MSACRRGGYRRRIQNEYDLENQFDHQGILPKDWPHGCLVGRVWRPDVQGPSVVVVRDGALLDISEVFPTMRDLCEAQEPAASVAALSGEPVGALDEVLRNTPPDQRDPRKPWLLAPIDLQAVKAAGVTFAVSLLERVIEEQARGNPQDSASIRNEIVSSVGQALDQLKPGSPQAASLKRTLDSKRASGLNTWKSGSDRTRSFSPRPNRCPPSGTVMTPGFIRCPPGTILSPRWSSLFRAPAGLKGPRSATT